MSEKKPIRLEEILDLHDPLPLLHHAHIVIKRRVDSGLALTLEETDYEKGVLETIAMYLEVRAHQND